MDASARSIWRPASCGESTERSGCSARSRAADVLRLDAGRPEDRRGGGDRQHLRPRDHHHLAQQRLAVDEQALGGGERHEHEAVGPGERLLEDADDAERLAADREWRVQGDAVDASRSDCR